MAKQTEAQTSTGERVMHEFKHHELKGSDGRLVRDPKQAIAMGLSEAGVSDRSAPAHGHDGARPDAPPEGGDASASSRSALYAEARRRDIPNRSKMNKAQLERALAKSPQPRRIATASPPR